jgi:protein-tyrosine-phosphatase
MAEGFLRAWAADRFEVASAGTEATRVHPLALRAMAEVGIDLSRHTSKTLDPLLSQPWDYVITAVSAVSRAYDADPLELRRPVAGHRGRGSATRDVSARPGRDPDAAEAVADRVVRDSLAELKYPVF